MKHSLLLSFLLLLMLHSFGQVKHQNGKIGDFVLGQVHTLYSELLVEDRKLNIYLPEGYQADIAYPVIYLLDGSADEDFIHVAGILQHNNFPWVERTAPSILVGIANTQRKKDFTSPSSVAEDIKLIPDNGGSSNFRAFLAQELQPYIARQFKTNGTNTLIGQSLAGLFALEVLQKEPQLFDNYIIVSPSLWWRQEYMLADNFKWASSYPKPINVYLAVGTEGKIYDGLLSMEESAKLLAVKLNHAHVGNFKLFFEQLQDEDHGTVGHQAILNAFKYFHGQQ